MHNGNPVECLAAAVYSAINNPEIIPDIYREWRGEKEKQRPHVSDLDVIHFPQLWGSTALGFGGIGGSAMTTAYTTVVISGENAAVFFNGRHCYSVEKINAAFSEDLKSRRMEDLKDATEKY